MSNRAYYNLAYINITIHKLNTAFIKFPRIVIKEINDARKTEIDYHHDNQLFINLNNLIP